MLNLNKKNIIIKILIIFFLTINIFTLKSKAVVNPTSDFYVNDYAGILDSDTKTYIINANKKLYKKTGAQIVVVTVPSLEGDSLENYATNLFRNFGIGDKIKNNGLLLLLTLEERKFRVEVGYGLEGTLNDAKTGRIQDEYIIPYLKDNNWNEGIKNGFSVFLKIVSNEYNVEIEGETPIPSQYVKENEQNSDITLFGFIVIPIISVIIGAIVGFLKKKQANKITICLFSIIYFGNISVIYMNFVKEISIEGIEDVFLKQLMITGFFLIFNIICFISGMNILKQRINNGMGGPRGRDNFFGGGFPGGSGTIGGGGFSGGGRKL